MGQKVNPISFRLKITRTWGSLWYAKKNDYAEKLHEDLKIRKFVTKELSQAGISSVKIERPAKKTVLTINAARPGMIIGRKGEELEKVKAYVQKITSGEVSINVTEVKKPEIDAALVAQGVAQQLEKRIAFRKAAKRAVQSAMRMGAKGVKVSVAGRLGGAEIARTEWYREGRVPLHNLRADIDYSIARANTTYGVIGVKVWVYKDDVFAVRANNKTV